MPDESPIECGPSPLCSIVVFTLLKQYIICQLRGTDWGCFGMFIFLAEYN